MKSLITLVLLVAGGAAFAQTDTVKQKKDTVTKVIYVAAETAAEFPGGKAAMNKFIKQNFKWTQTRPVTVGKVFVEFWIEPDGTLTGAHIERGLCQTCDKEALRLVSIMPNWTPATQLGKPIKSRYLLPVAFSL